jgi:hypothetical protein
LARRVVALLPEPAALRARALLLRVEMRVARLPEPVLPAAAERQRHAGSGGSRDPPLFKHLAAVRIDTDS